MAYDLEARFNVPDQSFSNAQILGASEGVDTGSLTVVEVDGTLAVSNLGMAYTQQTTVVFGDLGLVGPAITRAFGKTLYGRMWANNVEPTGGSFPFMWQNAANLAATSRIYYINFSSTSIVPSQGNAADRHQSVASEYDGLLHDYAIVMGGYDSSGNPWVSGSTTGFDYGASYYVRAPWSGWQLVWRTRADNTAILYPGFYNSTLNGTLDTLLVPTAAISTDHVQIDQHDKFTDTNGTGIASHTADIGGAYTVKSGGLTIQSNKLVPDASTTFEFATVDTGSGDFLAELDITVDTGGVRYLGLAFRVQDASNYWFTRVQNGTFYIYEVVSGSATSRVSASVTLTDATTYRLVVSAIGSWIAATVNNVTLTYTSTSLQNETEHGPFFRTDGSAGDLAIDNLTIYPVTDANYETVLEGIDDKSVTARRGALEYYQRAARRFVGIHDRTYFSWIGFDGKIWINYYDHDSSAYGTAVAVRDLYAVHGYRPGIDDHNAPSLFILPDGTLQVYWALHDYDVNEEFSMAASTSVEDISAWDSPVALGGDGSTFYGYPQVHRATTGNLILLYRRGAASDSEWYFKISADNGATWSATTQLTNFGASVGTYWYSTSSGDAIHLTGFKYNGTIRSDVYYLYTDNAGTTWKTIDGSTTTLPVAESDVDTVFDTTITDCRAQDIVLDIDGDPHILLIHNVSGTTPTFKYASHNGVSWDVTTITTTELILEPNFYSPGIAFDPADESIVYLSKQVSGVWEIQKWTTADSGATWSKAADITTGSAVHQFRVQAVLNPADNFNLIWMSGAYDGHFDGGGWVGYGRSDIQVGGTTIPISGTAPTAPSDLAATTVSSSQINLTWTDNSADETGFELQRDTVPTFDSPATLISPVANATSHNDTGLTANTLYYYRIRAINASGNSAYSNTSIARTEADAPTSVALSQTTDASGVIVTWVDDPSANGVVLERSDGGADYEYVAHVNPGVQTYTDTGFTVDVEACYQLKSYVGYTELFAGHNNVAAVNDDGYLYKTTDFQTPAASGGPTWSRVALGLDGSLNSYVVDPFSPLYVGTGSTVNCFIATTTRIYKVEDMFNASPTVTSLLTFAYEPVTGEASGYRNIRASFGRFFATASDNPWLCCVTNYGGKAGHTGTWTTYSVDGGATWSTEAQINAFYASGHSPFPGLYLSPKTPGLAYTAAFLSTAADPTADGYVSTDYGATWTRITDPDILPGVGLAGGMHVPWHNNSGEDIVIHGYETDIDIGGDYRTKKVQGTSITDVSPSDGTRYYAPMEGYFTIHAYDLDRRYWVMAGQGNGGAGTSFAAFVSSDYGDTWTQITPIATSGARPRYAAFAGNTPQVIYLWGTSGYIRYTQDFGATVDDRSGNIPSLGTPGEFLGIAGGD